LVILENISAMQHGPVNVKKKPHYGSSAGNFLSSEEKYIIFRQIFFSQRKSILFSGKCSFIRGKVYYFQDKFLLSEEKYIIFRKMFFSQRKSTLFSGKECTVVHHSTSV
jgi:hypothetical protein